MSQKVWHANEFSMLNGHERRVCQHLQRFTSNGGVSIMSGTLLKGQKELTIFCILLQNIYVDFFRFVRLLLITPNIFMQFSNDKSVRKIHPIFENLYILYCRKVVTEKSTVQMEFWFQLCQCFKRVAFSILIDKRVYLF